MPVVHHLRSVARVLACDGCGVWPYVRCALYWLWPIFRAVCSHTGALAVPISIRVTLRLSLASLSAVYVRADWREGAVSECRNTTL